MKQKTKVVLNAIIAGLLVFFGAATTAISEHGLIFEKLCTPLVLGLIGGVCIFLVNIQKFITPNSETKTASLLTNKKGAVRLFDFI